MTAVTTAGLLAGLFGSAFVPSVRAAAGDVAYSVSACAGSDYLKVVTASTALTGANCYFVSTKSPSVTITATSPGGGDADELGDYQFDVTGATIASISVGGTATLTGTIGVSYTRATFTVTTAAASATASMTIKLNPIAAGSTATITLTDAPGTVAASEGSKMTVTSIASAAASVVHVSSTTSAAAIAADMLENTAKTEWGQAFTAKGDITVDVKNTYGVAISTAVLSATISGDLASKLGVAVVDNAVTCANTTVYDTTWSAVSDGTSRVCVYRIDATDTTIAGTATLTIAAGGKTIKAITVKVYGDVASVAVTQLIKHVMIGSELEGTDAGNSLGYLTFKDAAGTTLPLEIGNANAIAAAYAALDGALAFKNAAGTAIDIDAGVAASYVDNVTPDAGNLSWDTGLCTTAGDIAVTASMTNVGLATKSATFTVKCTKTAAKINSIAFEKVLVGPGEVLKTNIAAVDADGVAVGYGTSMPAATTLTLSPATGAAASEISDDDASALAAGDFAAASWVAIDGTGFVKVKAPTTPGTYTMVLDYTDADATTVGSQAATYTLTLTVRNTNLASKTDLTAGSKKKIATADFGPGAAGLKVAFVLENASGVTKTFYRKANASGVAKYTIALRGTWTVYATFGDNITDTVTLKK